MAAAYRFRPTRFYTGAPSASYANNYVPTPWAYFPDRAYVRYCLRKLHLSDVGKASPPPGHRHHRPGKTARITRLSCSSPPRDNQYTLTAQSQGSIFRPPVSSNRPDRPSHNHNMPFPAPEQPDKYHTAPPSPRRCNSCSHTKSPWITANASHCPM